MNNSHLITDTFLHTKITQLPGVGAKTAVKLEKLQISIFRDLLWHLPTSYEDRTRITPITAPIIQQAISGPVKCLVQGQVQRVIQKNLSTKSVTEVIVNTEQQPLSLIFFNHSHRTKRRGPGFDVPDRDTWIRCFGKLSLFNRQPQMTHPDIQIIESPDAPLATTLTPIYPTTEGISQSRIRYWINWLLEKAQEMNIELDLIPKQLRVTQGICSLDDAITAIHTQKTSTPEPTSTNAIRMQPEQRLLLDPWLGQMLYLQQRKRQQVAKPFLYASQPHLDDIQKTLPFELTSDQEQSWQDIKEDLAQSTPMYRLLQGDVGSGKTIVALMAAAHIAKHGSQTALMVPTEVLAYQHFSSAKNLLEPLNIQVTLLIGSLTRKDRQQRLRAIATGDAKVIIGTHALFQEQTLFQDLNLIIIDEQHRFGVEQRARLAQKQNNQTPHQLFMSATPIPRTLALSIYNHLDTSSIKQLPAHRKAITTAILPNTRREEIYQRIGRLLDQGQQAYWVCPFIEATPLEEGLIDFLFDTEPKNKSGEHVHSLKKDLEKHLPGRTIALLHGRQSLEEKQANILSFQNKQADILIATSIIEVGIDVPNASLIVIEHAERWGLAQLHQLRGRVGRGHTESYCLLVYDPPLTDLAQQRLTLMKNAQDGFDIAEQDLVLRGHGDIIGLKQSGGVPSSPTSAMQYEQLAALLSKGNDIAQAMVKETANPAEDQQTRIKCMIRRWQKEEKPCFSS